MKWIIFLILLVVIICKNIIKTMKRAPSETRPAANIQPLFNTLNVRLQQYFTIKYA